MIGDEARFSALYETYYDRVLRYAARRAADTHTARDVVAETFLIAWRRLDAVPTEPDSALPWLFRVAANVLSNENRGRNRELRLRARLSRHRADVVDPAGQIADTDGIRRALQRLSDRDRELLRLIAWEGMDPAEAAQVLGCSARTLSVRLHRARRRLLDAMEASERREADIPVSVRRGRA